MLPLSGSCIGSSPSGERLGEGAAHGPDSEAESFSIMPAHHAKRPLLVVANARHSQAMAVLCA